MKELWKGRVIQKREGTEGRGRREDKKEEGRE